MTVFPTQHVEAVAADNAEPHAAWPDWPRAYPPGGLLFHGDNKEVLAHPSAGWAVPPRLAYAANLETTADRVFGQPDFTSSTINNGGVSVNSLYLSTGVALDKQGNLYVAD